MNIKVFKCSSLIIAVISLLVVLLPSCKDEENKLGDNLFPEKQKVGVFSDSLRELKAYSYQKENYISVTRDFKSFLFGCQNDDLFGSLQCDIITHVGLTSLKEPLFVKMDSIVEVDSCVLYLEFVKSEGDTIGKQKFNLYELNKDVKVADLDGKELYKHTLLSYFDKSKPLATYTYQPRKTWGKKTDNYSPIGFKLPKEFAEKLIQNQIIKNGDTILPYSNTDNFNKNILNGFYLESESLSESKSIATISKLSKSGQDSTRLQLFYKVKKADTTEVHSYTYNISVQPKANIFKNTLKKELVYNKMYTSIDMAKTDVNTYIKNNNGLYTRIVVENIGNWEDSGTVAINKVSVILPTQPREFDTYSLEPIRALYAYYKHDGKMYPLEMYATEKSLLPIKYNRKKGFYEVVITSEVQKLYKQKKWNEPIELIIQSATNTMTANSSIINSPTNPINPMKVILTYTKY